MGEPDARETLGLPSGASEDDLKNAYRKLALRYHPDRNRGDETAAARFREVSEAYAALRRGWRHPGQSRGGMDGEAACGFAFAAGSAFEFGSSGGADTAPCPARRIHWPMIGTGGPGIPDHAPRSGGRAARRSAGLSAPLCLVLGGVLIGFALPEPALVFGTHKAVRTAPSDSSAFARAPAADAGGFAAVSGRPERQATAGAEDAPGRLRVVAPAGDAPAGVAVPPAGGAPLARAGAPVEDVSADDAAPLWDGAPAGPALARPAEPTGRQVTARAAGYLAGGDAIAAEPSSGVPVARPGPPPTSAGPGAPTAAALFAVLMRHGEKAMGLSDVVGARSQYERAAALDPTSSTAAIAAGETYDPHVLTLAGVAHPWLADAAKAAAWYARARALGDPAAVSLLTRLR